ncbi:DNA cytosine methyltransferase [Bizionia myxarmorum]|uniref:DNA (cytosine-5-)-methyltransferase n=1 Tax=Bizionia myxarmorum TaxID=291186 RepID=A0A5D0RBN9_9FLAO|nr:DNA cytosine methyltransferase [Bizionia myxarmorum]TYB78321.1 hypothetical protein ES674_00645 [Bizionia myxarmorum]
METKLKDKLLKLSELANRGIDGEKVNAEFMSHPKGDTYTQTLEVNKNGKSNTLSTLDKDNLAIEPIILGYTRDSKGKVVKRNPLRQANTIHTATGSGGNTDQFVKQTNYKIRRLTPRECLRLMGFPDSFKMVCSDTQIYKQAGNSIVVHNLAALINNLINQ